VKRYQNLIGDGLCDDPYYRIKWNGHEFAQQQDAAGKQLGIRIVEALGLWPVIDQLLIRLYGEMSEQQRLAWYVQHKDDEVEMEFADGPGPQLRTVYRWSDRLQFRPVDDRLREIGIPVPEPEMSK
jgi:hypothetical protein